MRSKNNQYGKQFEILASMFLPTLWGGTFLPMHFGSHTLWAIFYSIPAIFLKNVKYTNGAFLGICQY